MYIPKNFQLEDQEKIYEIIEQNGFATLFSHYNGEPYATHLPLILDRENGILYGHFARPNEQWRDIENQTVLVTFQGPHCYISPSWYETNQAVPTWNYIAVHVYGNVEIMQNEQEILSALNLMIKKYENPNSLYDLNNIEPQLLNGLSKGIVPFKINITKIEGKAKLSQNHSAERQQLVIKQLELSPNQNEQKIAEIMKENIQF